MEKNMDFRHLDLSGAFLIEMTPNIDERGEFTRTYCSSEFASKGVGQPFVQCNISRNVQKGTLRGLHYQASPCEEGKLVRCSRGSVFDVLVDIREGSSTRYQWLAFELSEKNNRQLYVPPGFAHGFQTLEDDTEVFYQMTEPYTPDAARGMNWSDPNLGIEWPLPNPIVSSRDSSFRKLSDKPKRLDD
jgi:dTDP-4-dehydrorhamnose 3,5-epimerase